MPENTTQAIFFETIMLTSVACYCMLPFNTVINEAIEKNNEKNCLKTTTCNKEKKKIIDAGEFRTHHLRITKLLLLGAVLYRLS